MPSSSSGSDSDNDGNVEWAERKTSANDDWLGMAVGATNSFGRDSFLSKRDAKLAVKREEDAKRDLVYKSRELNPFLSADRTTNVFVEKEAEKKPNDRPVRTSSSATLNVSGDHGVGWLQKAFDRVYQQAKEQNKSPEEVAAERWGSLDKLKQMLEEAKSKLRAAGGSSSSRGRSNYDSHRGHRDNRGRDNRDVERDRRREDRSKYYPRDERDFKKYGQRDSRDDRDDKGSDRRGHGDSYRDRDSARGPNPSNNTTKSRVDEDHEDSNRNMASKMRASLTKNKEIDRTASLSKSRDDEPKLLRVEVRETVKEEQNSSKVNKLSDAEKNALHAKIMKAQMLGNEELVKTLQAKLDYYNNPANQQSSGADGPSSSSGKSRDVELVPKISEDNLTLNQMFMREKNRTAVDETKLFINSFAKATKPGDDDFEYDVERKAKKPKRDANPNQGMTSVQLNRNQDETCAQCLSRVQRHLVLSSGEYVYLFVAKTQPLVDGHCFIGSVGHCDKTMVTADEECLAEINLIKAGLVKLFAEKKKRVVFFESFRKKTSTHRNHLIVECVPIDEELIDETRMYFKKAVLESEGEWSMNKKLVELNGRCPSRALPKTLPYFWVSFGNTNEGYAHIIEDEDSFPNHFALEVIGGVLDIEPRQWTKPRFLKYEEQFETATRFKSEWSKFNPLVK